MHLVATLQSWLPLVTPPPLSAVMAGARSFQIMLLAGWLNDPNGLCQAGGAFMRTFSMRRLMSRAALRRGAMRRAATL